MVLHVQPPGGVVVPHDFVDTLTELRIGIGRKAGTDPLIRRGERFAPVLAEVMTARRDAEVYVVSVANNRMHAEAAVARLPFACMLMVADAGHHLPRIPAVLAPEQGGRLHTAPQLFFAAAGLERPDVHQRAAVVLGEGGG